MTRIPITVSRERLVEIAQRVATRAERESVPRGGRIVVIVTDEAGSFVGVGSNTNNKDVENILRAALFGADRRDHPNAIDTVGEEAP
jgi:hypothetical protein